MRRNLYFVYSPTEPAAAAPVVTTTPEPVAPTSSATTATTTTPAATPAATVTPAAADTSTPGSATTVGATTPAAPSWLDGFRAEGLRITETDEAKVRKQLTQAYQDAERLRPLAPQLHAYQQHQAEFEKYLAEKNKAAQQQAAQTDWTAELYQHPTYDPNWQHQVTRDANGNLVPVAGAPADVVGKYQAAQAFRQEQVEKFLTNPFKFMEPAIRKIAGDIASQQAQQGVGQYRDQQEAQQFVSDNSSWLYEQDSGKIKTTQVLNTQTGRYEESKVLSNYGQLFLTHLQEGARQGLTPKMQQEYAMKSIQNAYMASPEYADYIVKQRQAAATPAPAAQTPREAANAAFTQRANPAQQPAPTGGNAVPSTPKVTRENLESVMLKTFRDAGVTGL